MNRTHVEYKLRAECMWHATLILGVLQVWLLRAEIGQVTVLRRGKLVMLPEVEVQLSIREDGPDLGELQWLIDGLGACTMAAETVAPIQHYTGNRVPLDVTDSLPRRPQPSLRVTAMTAMVKWAKSSKPELELAFDAATRLAEMLGRDIDTPSALSAGRH